MDAAAQARRGGGGDGAGSVLGLSPLHARSKDDASTTTRRSRSACSPAPALPVRKRYVVDGQAFYYRNAQHPGAPLKDVVQVYYQFKNEQKRRARHADAGRHRFASIRPIRKAACSSSARIASTTRRRTRPSTSRSATPSTSSASASRPTSRRSPIDVYEVEYQITLRNHKTIAGHRRSQRADWRHVADAALVARMDEDGRVGRPVHGAGRRGQRSRAEVSRPDKLLIRGRA